jgi:hypothetical protein
MGKIPPAPGIKEPDAPRLFVSYVEIATAMPAMKPAEILEFVEDWLL